MVICQIIIFESRPFRKTVIKYNEQQQKMKQKTPMQTASGFFVGRGERIRTSGLCFPKAALYQAELRPGRVIRVRPWPSGVAAL
jgi:hypothetical protein